MAEIDRENTIEGLKRYLNYPKPLCDVAQQAITLLKEQEAQRDYEASVEMAEYCERYEQTYNPEDGSM